MSCLCGIGEEMQPCGRCGGNNVEAHHVRSEHCGGIRCEATRGMVHDSGTPFSRAASGATVLRGMRVTETMMHSVWRTCFTTGLRQWAGRYCTACRLRLSCGNDAKGRGHGKICSKIPGRRGQHQKEIDGEKRHSQHNAEKKREFHGSPPMPETGCGEREGTVTGRSVLFQAS